MLVLDYDALAEPMSFCTLCRAYKAVQDFDFRVVRPRSHAQAVERGSLFPGAVLWKWCRNCTIQRTAHSFRRQRRPESPEEVERRQPRTCGRCGVERTEGSFRYGTRRYDACRECRSTREWRNERDRAARSARPKRATLTPEERSRREKESDARYNAKRNARAKDKRQKALADLIALVRSRDGTRCAGCGAPAADELAVALPGRRYPLASPQGAVRLVCGSCRPSFYRRFCAPKPPSPPRPPKPRPRRQCDNCADWFCVDDLLKRIRWGETFMLCSGCEETLPPPRTRRIPDGQLTKKQLKNRRWNERNGDKIKEHVRMRRAAQRGLPKEERVPKNLLVEVFGGRCFFCGVALAPGSPETHDEHLTPLSRGGSDGFSNRVASCAPCNFSKGRRTLAEFIEYRSQEAPWMPWGLTTEGQESLRSSARTAGFSDPPQLSTWTALDQTA